MTYVPAEAESAFNASVYVTEDFCRLTLVPKAGCAYVPAGATIDVDAANPEDSVHADLKPKFPSPQASYVITYGEPLLGAATFTVTFDPLYAIATEYVPAAAAASFSNDCPAKVTKKGETDFSVWEKDGCAYVPDFAAMSDAVAAPVVGDGVRSFSLRPTQDVSSDQTVSVFCSPLSAWWRGGGLVRAAWQDASVEAAHSAFRHGDDVFVVSGAAGKMLVRAQYAAADLQHAVGGMGASPASPAYEVALSGLEGSDATAVPAAFAAVASGERVYAIVGKKVVRFAAAYSPDAPRRLESLTAGESWPFADTPVSVAVATVGGRDLAYVQLEHQEAVMSGETISHSTSVLDTETGDVTVLFEQNDKFAALAVSGAAVGAPHLLRCPAENKNVEVVALKASGDGILSAQQLASFGTDYDCWTDARPDALFILAADDETSLFVGGTNTAGKLQAFFVQAVPPEVTVRVALPVAGGTNDFALAYGVATNFVVNAPAGYCFSSVAVNGERTTLEGTASYEFATDARRHASLDFELAYTCELEVLGPEEAISAALPARVAVGASVEASVAVVDATYAIAAIAVDGVPVEWSVNPDDATGSTYQFSGVARNGAKVVVALQSTRAWYTDKLADVAPAVQGSFAAEGVAPGDGRSVAFDAANGRLAFGLSATAEGAGLAEFSTAELLDAVATESVAPVWSENSAGRGGEAWGRSVAALAKYAAWISCNAEVAGEAWVNPQGGAWSEGAEKPNAAYAAAFSGVPGGADALKLSVVAGNAAGDALYGACGAKLYKFGVSDDGATPAKITGFAWAGDWDLAAEPGALAVATIGGRDVVYCAPAAGGAVQVVDVGRAAAADLGVSGTFTSLSASGVAAGMPHLAAVSGTTVSHWALSGDGLRALSAAPLASRDLAPLLGASSAPSGVYFAELDDESVAFAACRDGSELRVAKIVQTPSAVALRGRFFGADGEVGVASNVLMGVTSEAFAHVFAAPPGHKIVGVKKNGVAVGGLALPAFEIEIEFAGGVSEPVYFEIQVGATTPIELDLLGYAYLVEGDTDALVGEDAHLTFGMRDPDGGDDDDPPPGAWISSVYVNGRPAEASADLTIPSVQPGTRVVVTTSVPRDAPETPWHSYTSRHAFWNETAFDAALPVAQGALDATDEYLLELFGTGGGGARLCPLTAAERGNPAPEAVWTLPHGHALFGGEMRGGAVAKQLDVALLGSADGAFMVSAPLHFAFGETFSAANTFRVTAVTPAGDAAATPTAFAFSPDALWLYGGGGSISGVNKYRVLDGLKSAGTNLVLEANFALGSENQACESLVVGAFGGEAFLYAIGAADRKIYVVKLSDGSVADTGVVAATPHDAMALTAKSTAEPHLTLFKGATGGGDAALVVHAADPATGALGAEPVKAFTGAQLGSFAGFGSVDASSAGPARSLTIADNEAFAILGTDWNSSPSGLGGTVTHGRRVVLGPISSLNVVYTVVNGTLDGADEGAEGEVVLDGTSATLSFTKAEATLALRSVTVNGEAVEATKTPGGCTLPIDYTQVVDGTIEVVVDFEVPAVSVWVVGPADFDVSEDGQTYKFIERDETEVYSVFANGVAIPLERFEDWESVEQEDGSMVPVLVRFGVKYSAAGITEDVRLVVAARERETPVDHPWWENPGVRSTAAAPAGAVQAAYHFAAAGAHFAYTQDGTGRLFKRLAGDLVACKEIAPAAHPGLSGAGVCERLNVVLFGTSVPGAPILSAEIAPSATGGPEDPVEIGNDLGLALDQFAFSEDGGTLYAICPASSTAADCEKIYAFEIRHALKRAGTHLLFSQAFDFGSAVKSFACATNASGAVVAYALLANGTLAARNLTSVGAAAALRTEPFAGGAAGGSVFVSAAGTARARITVAWSNGEKNRVEVFGLTADGAALAGSEPLAAFDDADLACLGISSVCAHPAVWASADDGTAFVFHGGITGLSYDPAYVITFDVRGGAAYTNGAAVTSPYAVNFRSPCDVLDFRGLTDLHYLSAAVTNGVVFPFDELTARHPTNFTFRGTGADAVVSVGFTPAMDARFDLVGGADMARIVPVDPAETRPYRPGETVTFQVEDVKEGYQLAAISTGGETIPCDPAIGQFTYRFVDHGDIVVAFAKTNAWWTAPAVRNTIRRNWQGSVPTGLGCDGTTGELVFGRGDAAHPGFTHYAGAEIVETVDPVLAPDHEIAGKTPDVARDPLDSECAPYAAVSALADLAVGSPASAEGQLAYYVLSAEWSAGCGFAVMQNDAIRASMAAKKMMAFSGQKVGAAFPALYGYDPGAGKVARYTYEITTEKRCLVSDVFEEKDFPAGLAGFTCRTVAGRDVLYAANGAHVYAFDFAAGELTDNRYEFDEPMHASQGVVGLQVTGVADGTPHVILLNKPYKTVELVDSGEPVLDENGEQIYEEVLNDDGTPDMRLVTRIDPVTNWFGGVSVFALSNDCRTLVGTRAVFEHQAGKHALPGSAWGAFGTTDDETRAFNLTADGTGRMRLETVEHATDTYYVEAQFVDPFGKTIRRDRSYTFTPGASGATRLSRTYYADDRYAISAVALNGQPVTDETAVFENRYLYDSGLVEVETEAGSDSYERVVTRYEHVKITEGFKPVIRQQLVGGVTSSRSAEAEIVSAGSPFEATYAPAAGFAVASA
ncbi:MAG: hypothetical protein MJ138_04480, partial [Kiritimatiellae bacterium]|nr:hypothetical protein [Kiritimatiellia bacterium]